MSLKDITITASINSIPTQSYGQKTYIASTDEQSFPIVTTEGGNGGSMPNLLGQTSSIDLFVNITQSWTGSINTPVGLVSFLHEDQSEFINGEFSGSVLTVTTQSLNPECWPILFPIQPGSDYNYYFYYQYENNDVNIPLTQASNFWNSNTIPNPGEIYFYARLRDPYVNPYNSIEECKINRIDKQGNDNTFSLQELKSLRANFTDIGIVQYDILFIAEFTDYYAYTIVPNSNFSITDNNIIDHNLSADILTTYPTAIVDGAEPIFIDGYSLNNDPSNYFNITTGQYTFGDTPNVPLSITASVRVPERDYILWLFRNRSGIINSIKNEISIPGGVSILYLSQNITDTVETDVYFLGVSQTYGGSDYIKDITLEINQLAAANTSINPAIFDPYLISTFANSDCDVLMNNVELNEYDKDFMKVNYDSGQLIPTNQQQIISGTAEPAPVKAYNYRILSQILPRYDGVRTESPNFNLPASNQFGQVPNAEQTNTYFLYFESMESTSPLIKNKTSVKGKYLIREDGTVFDLNTDDVTYSNVIYSFERDKKAYASLFKNQSSTLTVTQSIFKSGQYYTPILYNLSASFNDSASFSQTIDFVNINGTSVAGIPNFDLFVTSYENSPTYPSNDDYKRGLGIQGGEWYSLNIAPGPQAVTTSPIVNPFYYGRGNKIYADTAGGWIDGTPTLDSLNHAYYVFNTQPLSLVDIEIKISYNYYRFVGPTAVIIETTLWSSGSAGIYRAAPTQTNQLPPTYYAVSQCYLKVPNYQAYDQEALYVTVEVKNPSLLGYYGLAGIGPQFDSFTLNPLMALTTPGNTNYGQSTFKIITKNYTPPTPSYPFWFTGSANDTVLTSSVDLGSALQTNFQQIDIPDSGMPIIEYPAIIKPGDEIRFEYDESNTFIIKDAYLSGSNVIIEVDHPIPSISTININHFTIRRPEKDLTHTVILDTKLNKPIDDGFLFPEYPSDQIKKNLPNIINDLYNRTLI